MLRLIAKISIILFALAMLPIAEIIYNTNTIKPIMNIDNGAGVFI